MAQNDKQFDVALSFAGEDRSYVEKVAHTLMKMGIRVFYDKYELITLWGKDLYTHLMDVYQGKARYTIIFCSKYYAEKLWTNHERRAAQAKAFESNVEYILPARFDDTKIPGILSTTGFIDLNEYSPEVFAQLVKKKIGPMVRAEFFPEEPDLLYEAINAKTKIKKKKTFNCAMHFFRALTLMTPDERWLLATAIDNTCPAGPSDNVHLDIELFSRLVRLSPDEIISKFARLSCLGIEAKLEKTPIMDSDNLCKMIEAIYIRFQPHADNCLYNATYIAIGIVKIIFEHCCQKCRKKVLDSLDFSILSRMTGFPEKHLN